MMFLKKKKKNQINDKPLREPLKKVFPYGLAREMVGYQKGLNDFTS